jgi:hypothetical protein
MKLLKTYICQTERKIELNCGRIGNYLETNKARVAIRCSAGELEPELIRVRCAGLRRRRPRSTKRTAPLIPHRPLTSQIPIYPGRHREPLAGRRPSSPFTTASPSQVAGGWRPLILPLPPPPASRVQASEDGEAPVPDRAHHALQLRPPLRLRPLPRLLPQDPRRRKIQ